MRFDSYYSGINNKGAFLLAFNTFLIGAFLFVYKNILEMITCCERYVFNMLIGLILLLSVISMVLTIISIKPYIRPSKIRTNKSNWFFNDIALENKEEFFDRINNTTLKEQETDLNNQIFELSKGLRRKYKLIKSALTINLIGVIILLPIIYIILN